MRTVAIVQARTSSSRFPQKVLALLQGVPMIIFMLNRVHRAKRIDEIVLATSTDPSDDALVQCVTDHGFSVYRGDLDDVLDRFAGAARQAQGDIVVRLTGDCPLIDPDVIDMVVAALQTHPRLDYASNVAPPTFPDGLDVEAFRFEALDRAARDAKHPSEREHVTPYIRENTPDEHKINIRAAADFSQLRWTVDYPDDLSFVESLLEQVGINESPPDRFDFYRALEKKPQLQQLNQHERNEGLALSLLADQSVTPK